MYIKRDAQFNIVAISRVPVVGYEEHREADTDTDLVAFLEGLKSSQQVILEQSDLAMARVLEDVIQLLVTQGTIRFTDLPDAAQHKLLARRELRGQRQAIDLLDDGDNISL